MKSVKYICLMCFVMLAACQEGSRLQRMAEDKVAKDLLQGIWVDDSSDLPVFMVVGDTLHYSDPNAVPILFKIIRDSIYLLGVDTISYKIERQGESTFWFTTATDELMKLHRSEYEEDLFMFSSTPLIIK